MAAEKGNIFFKEECADYLSDIPDDFDDREIDDSDNEIEDSSMYVQYNLGKMDISSDSEESDLNIEDDWSDFDLPKNNEPFESSPGPNIFLKSTDKVEDVAGMFIGDDLFEFIAAETNKYYAQNSQTYKSIKNTGKWFNLTVTELKKWFALVIIMGLVRKCIINDYWSSNPLIETPIFSKTMSRNRFRQILSFLHFSDNTTIPETADRLFKIQKIIDYFMNKFKDNYKPKQNLSIHESIIPWNRKLNPRIYNPKKINKYGILIRMLCDSTTGYICNFYIYSCAEQQSEIAILKLLTPFTDKWHHVYMNNFCNSVELAQQLLFKKIRICSTDTIEPNQGLPEILKKAKLKIFEATFKRKGEIILQLWKTNKGRHIRMISTIHNANVVNTGKTDRKTGCPIQKPKSIIEYNQHMKGVNNTDQFLNYYPLYRKTKKWTTKVVFYLMNCGLFNAFKLYEILNVNSDRKLKFYDFLMILSKAWLEDSNELDTEKNSEIPTTSRTSRVNPIQRLSGNLKHHQLVKISETGNRKRKRCKVCYTNKIRKDTYFMCKFCKVALHLGECFASYHLKKSY